jgi:hypothetical protein
MEAGDYISKHLGRPVGSKTAAALRKHLSPWRSFQAGTPKHVSDGVIYSYHTHIVSQNHWSITWVCFCDHTTHRKHWYTQKLYSVLGRSRITIILRDVIKRLYKMVYDIAPAKLRSFTVSITIFIWV